MGKEQLYTVLEEFSSFELRHYPTHVMAEVAVHASFADAATVAYGFLHGYLHGGNRGRAGSRDCLVANLPVAVEMTAPLMLRDGGLPGVHLVGFALPADYDLDTAPLPRDPAVVLRGVPDRLGAAARLGGKWTGENFHAAGRRLAVDVAGKGLRPAGAPRFARFEPRPDARFRRGRRRAEVVVDIAPAGR